VIEKYQRKAALYRQN
jgi:hypothetical protein